MSLAKRYDSSAMIGSGDRSFNQFQSPGAVVAGNEIANGTKQPGTRRWGIGVLGPIAHHPNSPGHHSCLVLGLYLEPGVWGLGFSFRNGFPFTAFRASS